MLLSLDLSKCEEHGASVNSHTYDMYHLAYTLPNSIEDPIIRCIYFVEIQLLYDTCFKFEPTTLRVQIQVTPKSIYEVQVIPEQSMKGHINELEPRREPTSQQSSGQNNSVAQITASSKQAGPPS